MATSFCDEDEFSSAWGINSFYLKNFIFSNEYGGKIKNDVSLFA